MMKRMRTSNLHFRNHKEFLRSLSTLTPQDGEPGESRFLIKLLTASRQSTPNVLMLMLFLLLVLLLLLFSPVFYESNNRMTALGFNKKKTALN